MKQILSYIDNNLSEKLGLKQMASELGLSPYYFSHLFRQSMGMPPYRYVIQQRVQKAKRLLKQEVEMSIADIALECGFTSQSHMAKHFRQITGTTPKAYRGE